MLMAMINRLTACLHLEGTDGVEGLGLGTTLNQKARY